MDIDTSFKNTKRKLLTNEHRDFFKFYDKTNFPKMRRILRDRLGTKIGYDINYDGEICQSLSETINSIKKSFKFWL